MRGRFAVRLVAFVVCAFCLTFSVTVVYADGPVIDRCLEYLNPYTPIEWNRCIGNEFNKFPDAPTELKELYLHAPASGEWPSPQLIVAGDNAPIVELPYSDETGQVYVIPHGTVNQVPAYGGSGTPTTGYWWQAPTSAPPADQQIDMYTSWQNYWMSHGATGYGGWPVPGGYAAAPW